MAEEWSSSERYWAAINLEKPDRAPISTLMTTPADATLLGMKESRPLYEDNELLLKADLEVFDKYGGWDLVNPLVPVNMILAFDMEYKLPESGSLDIQTIEREHMKPEDYEKIIEMGSWSKFFYEELLLRDLPWNKQIMGERFEETERLFVRHKAEVEKRGAIYQYREDSILPFFQFSLARSMLKFTEDLYFRPDLVEKALEIATDDYIVERIESCKKYDCKVTCVAEERASTFFYSPSIFERFWWPNTVKVVDALWSEGIVSWFHLDTPWDKNLPYFKQLPKGSFVIDLDGTTDIFAAKELLRGHCCIGGDVNAALFQLGDPADVDAYVKRLIDEVGGDGGFILNVACNLPGGLKVENFEQYLETGKTYKGESA